jgi:hypothetical protein
MRSSGPIIIIASRVVSTVVRHSVEMAESRAREMVPDLAARDRFPAGERLPTARNRFPAGERPPTVRDVFTARLFVVFGMIAARDHVIGGVVYYSASARSGRSAA